MDTLAKLFSSATLVKVMRLFLLNPHERYTKDDIVAKTKSDAAAVGHEVKLLESVGLLKRRSFFVERADGKKKRARGWEFDESFPHTAPLKALVVNADLVDTGELERRLSKAGRLKLLVAAGVFTQESGSPVDLLIVGEKLQPKTLSAAIVAIESAIGSEVRYTAFAPEEFEYRMAMHDRLLRDVFEYPHLIIKNTLSGKHYDALLDS